MALHLNLLHEQIAEKRQRQRDPLKLGFLALLAIGAVMILYYLSQAYQTLQVKRHLSDAQREWAQIEPKMAVAQKRSKELTTIIGTTKILDEMIEDRFFWAPFMERLARCVAPNAQITNLEGNVTDDKAVTVSIDGTAAGREPRAAAEELRQLLIEQLGQSYSNVKVEFRSLEDLDTIVRLGGANMAMARFTLLATFNPMSAANKAAPAPAHPKK